MCTHAFAVLVTGFVLTAAGLFPGTAHAQSDSAKPAVLDCRIETYWKSCCRHGFGHP